MKQILSIILVLFSFISFSQVSTTFTGTASDTLGGSVASVKWRQISGPSAVIASPNTLTTSVTFTVAGTCVFGLVATDNDGATSPESLLTVIVSQNYRPKANAGPNQTLKLPGLLGAYFKNKQPDEKSIDLAIAFVLHPDSDNNN